MTESHERTKHSFLLLSLRSLCPFKRSKMCLFLMLATKMATVLRFLLKTEGICIFINSRTHLEAYSFVDKNVTLRVLVFGL